MPCPFLTRLGSKYVRNYAPALLENFGHKCPVAARTISSLSNGEGGPAGGAIAGDQTASPTPAATTQSTQRNLSSLQQPQHTKTAGATETRGCPVAASPACPILSSAKTLGKEVSEDIQAIPNNRTFPYEEFFHDQIMRKKRDHSYRIFKKVNRLAGTGQFPTALEYSWGEKPITVWCSNDYLGMSCHPEVKMAVRTALEEHGAGAGGTRNIAGNSLYHEKLESLLAKLHQKEAALLFTSCFVANDSTLFTLAKALPGCHIFSDAGNHASMIHGIRNSQVPKHIFRHNDPEHLRELLSSVDKSVPKIVAFETVHSMTGAVCPLKELCEIAHEFGALTFVDEVHAVGLYGQHGAGIGERDNQLHNMDMISGTLGKAFGNIGGYIVGSSLLIDMIRSYAAGFIFTTSLPPTVLAGTIRSIEILASDEGRQLRAKHQEAVRYLRTLLQREGFPVEHTPSHIIPIKIGDPLKCGRISDLLIQEYGHYVQAINYPTVARGQEKMRMAPTPFHTPAMMDVLVDDMKQVWKTLDLPLTGPNCTKECEYCRKPILFDHYEARVRSNCAPTFNCLVPNCPQLVAAAN